MFVVVGTNLTYLLVVFGCEKKYVVEWFSSSIMSSPSAGKYYVNVRCVQKFLVYNIYIAYIHTYEKYISILIYTYDKYIYKYIYIYDKYII